MTQVPLRVVAKSAVNANSESLIQNEISVMIEAVVSKARRISIQGLLNREGGIECTAVRTDDNAIESVVMGGVASTSLQDPTSLELVQRGDCEKSRISSIQEQLSAVNRIKRFVSARSGGMKEQTSERPASREG